MLLTLRVVLPVPGDATSTRRNPLVLLTPVLKSMLLICSAMSVAPPVSLSRADALPVA